MSWTETTTTQIQNRKYGAYQARLVQTNRASTSPTPATTAHQPSQRPSTRVLSTTQPQATAKLPIATQALAKPRLPTSKA